MNGDPILMCHRGRHYYQFGCLQFSTFLWDFFLFFDRWPLHQAPPPPYPEMMLPNPGLKHLSLLLANLKKWSHISHCTDLSIQQFSYSFISSERVIFFSRSLSNIFPKFVDVAKPNTKFVLEGLLLVKRQVFQLVWLVSWSKMMVVSEPPWTVIVFFSLYLLAGSMSYSGNSLILLKIPKSMLDSVLISEHW